MAPCLIHFTRGEGVTSRVRDALDCDAFERVEFRTIEQPSDRSNELLTTETSINVSHELQSHFALMFPSIYQMDDMI